MFSHICSTSEERPLVETARNAIAKHETPPAHRAVGASMGGIGSKPSLRAGDPAATRKSPRNGLTKSGSATMECSSAPLLKGACGGGEAHKPLLALPRGRSAVPLPSDQRWLSAPVHAASCRIEPAFPLHPPTSPPRTHTCRQAPPPSCLSVASAPSDHAWFRTGSAPWGASMHTRVRAPAGSEQCAQSPSQSMLTTTPAANGLAATVAAEGASRTPASSPSARNSHAQLQSSDSTRLALAPSAQRSSEGGALPARHEVRLRPPGKSGTAAASNSSAKKRLKLEPLFLSSSSCHGTMLATAAALPATPPSAPMPAPK
mmetsp:Transcript_32007/g.95207  ORF Transcript_32007/g.95207 Transcript_32007/m.95207 type:complete len:317 (+) Transcript_32007:107-1057(+)